MLKKLKSLFVIDDQEPNDQKEKVQAPIDKKSSSEPSSSVNKNVKQEDTPIKGTGQPEDKFVDRLLGALEENNMEGFDYLEYKQALQNLGNMEMDEATRFKSALAMATTMGASTPKLISSAEHYVKVLKAEENKFITAFKGHQDKQVSDQEQNFKNLEQAIVTKEKQIEQLQKEIEQHKKDLTDRKSKVNQANAKIQSTKENFYASYNIVINQIVDDISKMKQYLN